MLVSLFAYVWMGSAQIVTPRVLETALKEPAAQAYLLQINQIEQRGNYQNELRSLTQDTSLSPAAKEWLLAHSLSVLLHQSASPSAQAYVSELTGFKSEVQLVDDLEGRERHIPLTQIAINAEYTLRWWRTQELVKALAPKLALTDWQALSKTWSSLTTEQQHAYELSLRTATPSSSWQVPNDAFARFAQIAPALAVAIIEHEQSAKKLHYLLSNSDHSTVVDYVSRLPHWLAPHSLSETLWSAAQKNAPLRGLLYSKMVERAPSESHAPLWKAAQQGDRAALYALSQWRGDALIADLKSLWSPNHLESSALVITGLRFINSANANDELRQLAQQKHLPRTLAKELAPWR